MDKKRVLISIRHMKQYFPLKTNKKLFVRANDDVSLDIYEGETLGLVGESGCGKSTLGRVLLQLYRQTAGDVLYYGVNLYDLAPAYIGEILKDIKPDNVNPLLAAAAGNEPADKKLTDMLQIIGGLILSDNLQEAVSEYQKLFETAKLRHDQNKALKKLILNRDEAGGESKTHFDARIAAAEKAVAEKNREYGVIQESIAKKRKECENKPYFAKYEALRDEGIDLARLSYNEMRQLRSDIQLIFQDPYSSLNPRMTVGQIIGEGLKAHGFFKTESERYTNFISDIMNDCGLAPYMIHRYPHQFSGGQRQRIGIARSLALSPKFVVCDEAVSALDVSIQSQILNLLQDLKEKRNLTYMFISHDLSVVKYISNRIGVMYLGNIVELAETAELFKNPLHPYTEALLSAIPTTDADRKREEYILEGDIPSPINPPKGCKFHTRCRYATDICREEVPEFVKINDDHYVACHLRTHSAPMQSEAGA